MKKIDRETVQRILDSANIVEVVSDFVNLKKRGANYIGLCPFHNERTPSFSVSPARGICKCFSCGKGGSPVNFIMEHEQLTYYEALRYLAKKYNIEIREHEMTDTERQEASERESMIAVNDFALKHFEQNMLETPDGRDIGLAYFRERGINDQMIKKFRLGYALDKGDHLYKTAIARGFNEKYLLDTGLCAKSERGVYDRFRGRVIYPIFSVSGRVVAFGGRTLRTDKSMAKYVNSPESLIYRKSYELYGLYQAKSSIVKHDKCILVEGYMDVISMHQVGVENVVASSGTSLTEGQIRLIHRFTQNVTVIYDSDPAGIKASLRGIDLLLAEGLNIKVVLLPDGDDPDSFAQAHSSTQVEEYIAQHEIDFISFKTNILLKDAGADLLKRSQVISDIIGSIAVIPDQVTRALYISECSRVFNLAEKVLTLEVDKRMATNAEKRGAATANSRNFNPPTAPATTTAPASTTQEQPAQAPLQQPAPQQPAVAPAVRSKIGLHELVLMKYVVKYGFVTIAQMLDDNGEGADLTVAEYIASQLEADEIALTNPTCSRMLAEALRILREEWPADFERKKGELLKARQEAMAKGLDYIRTHGRDLADMQVKEQELTAKADADLDQAITDYTKGYLVGVFLSSPDDELRTLATRLASERYQLSKVHTKYQQIETEYDRLQDLVERAVHELKFAILDQRIAEYNQEMRRAAASGADTRQLMEQIYELYQLKAQFGKILGDRIVNPK